MIRRAVDVAVSARLRCVVSSPVDRARGAGRSASRRPATRSTASGGWARTAASSTSTSCARWSPAPSTSAPGWPSTRATRASPASAHFLRLTSLDELPEPRQRRCAGEMSLVGPRPTIQVQVDAVHAAPARPPGGQARHHRLGPGQRPHALPWPERIELDLWYVDHRSLRLDVADPAGGPRGCCSSGEGLYKGDTGGWKRPDVREPAMKGVLLTGVGKRYDIVSAFAQHATVVAADPNPLAPAQYAATRAHAPCRASTTRATCPRCRRCATSATSGRSCR